MSLRLVLSIISVAGIISNVHGQTPPVVNLSSNAPFCEGTADLHLYENGGAAISWNWTGPNGFHSTEQHPNIIKPQAIASGLYAVTITDANSVTNTASIQISIQASPQISSPDQPAVCPGNLYNLSNISIWENNPAAAGVISWHSASPANAGNLLPSLNVSPASNTIYYALSTNTNGCTAEMPIEIAVHPQALANAGPDLFICPGGSDTLMASGGVSCSWTPITGLNDPNSCNPIASPGSTTTYYVTITDAAGCTATDQVKVVVHVPTPLACNNLVTIALDEDGKVEINPDQILEGTYPYEEFYKVSIMKNNGLSLGNLVTCTQIGQTLTVKVTDICTGQLCWGTIKVVDNLPPKMACTSLTVPCILNDYSPGYLDQIFPNPAPFPYPVVTDNCTVGNLVFNDSWHDLGCSGQFNDQTGLTAYIQRVWSAKDTYGNSASCTQYIYIKQAHLNDIVFPQNAIVPCENPLTSPQQTGAPSIVFNGITFPVYPDAGHCGIATDFTDQLLPHCAGSYKIKREWTFFDWCLPTSPGNPYKYVQLINVQDIKGPAFKCPASFTVSTDPFNCCAVVDLPDFVATENCSKVNSASAMIVTYDPDSGAPNGMYTVNANLTDFPGNNLWASDTLAQMGATSCLPRGIHEVTYIASDDCGNTSSCLFNLTVADNTPPAVACTELTQVAISANGAILVNASTFDQGSVDNCSPVRFKARRMDANSCQTDTLFQDQVKFCCSDINDTITVILRVYDVALPNGPVSLDTLQLHSNDCMVRVLVEDKIKPVCQAPSNVTVNCENFDPTLGTYGGATASDNCCVDTLINTINYNLFDTICSRGTIVRNWRVTDCSGNSSQCSQRVYVDYKQDYYLKMPDDKLILSCDGTGNYGAPTFFNEDCELIGYSYHDVIFTLVPDACFKIERTWKIINWCTYNPAQPCIYVPNPNPSTQVNNPFNFRAPVISPPGTPGFWTPTVVSINPGDPPTNFGQFWDANANCYEYTQIIKIEDTQDPVITDCPASPVQACDLTANNSALWNSASWWDPGTQSHDLCEGPVNLNLTAWDACSDTAVTFRYLLFLDLDMNGTMETVINSFDPPAPGTVRFGNAFTPNYSGGEVRVFDHRNVPDAQKYRFGLSTVIVGNKKKATFQMFSGNTPVEPELPYGTHKIKWNVEDGCGNEKTCEYNIIVRDCKKPTVVCHNGLSVNIMPGGMIQLWASDFLQYADDNCTPANLLRLAIRKSGQGNGFPLDDAGNPANNVVFDCSELGTQTVELWAMDLAGNADYCETYIIIQDNNSNCSPLDASVAGKLLTEQNAGLEDATILLEGMTPQAVPMNASDFSNTQGQYQFNASIPAGASLTVTPVKEDNPINGVSTFDLVLISKHILGLEPLTSPFKMIAADVNNSGSITTFDIVELRKLILGVYTDLPMNSSWRFIRKDFKFPEPSNPFQTVFAENFHTDSFPGMQAPMQQTDFTAIKIGDINGNAIVSSFSPGEDRDQQLLLLDVAEKQLQRGMEFTVPVSAGEWMEGYQFTLQYEDLELLDIQPGAGMSSDNFAAHTADNAISASFAPDKQSGKAEFALRFRVLQNGQLSQFLHISSKITRAEAYSTDTHNKVQVHDIALRFNNGLSATIAGSNFEMYQNQPNPFRQHTRIGFYLPEAGKAQLQIFDETGRAVYSDQGQFTKGDNSFQINRLALPTSGLLYYRIESGKWSDTKKMIGIK